ncbi:uncharacterized protein LOC121047486 [Ixodes scapularis]|uniref:uncharacterized protein LOC121047486 n=1 Tax=Ixodes scapularis TaxID=6945 RepID=UPI001C38915B|nr:uncharacterized protein LOC121047486 [Ixodes scapularis]
MALHFTDKTKVILTGDFNLPTIDWTSCKVGEPCNTTQQCWLKDPDLTCLDQLCACPADKFPTAEGRCNPRRKLGENCTNDKACSAMLAACINGLCSCPVGFKLQKENSCVKSDIPVVWKRVAVVISVSIACALLLLLLCCIVLLMLR